MEQKAAAGTTVDKLAAALNSIEAENPHLKEVLQAFRGILLEQARWKAELPIPDCPEINRPDSDRFEKGVPLTDREWFCRLGELWPTAAERMIPVMIAGFPKLQHELQQLQTAIQRRAFAPDLFLSALFGGRAAEAREHAEAAGFTSEVLEFALIQAAKPIIDKLNAELAKAISLPDVKKHLSEQLGMDLVVSSPEALQTWTVGEIARWGKVIKENGIRAD